VEAVRTRYLESAQAGLELSLERRTA
jgi:hypothetical protein